MKTRLESPFRPGDPRSCLRVHLQHELARRCAANPLYSLRAFALDLGTDHASLSQILRGRRALTPAMVERFALSLGLDAAERDGYQRAARLASREPASDFEGLTRLADDAQRVVAEWQHHALLELVRCKSFRPDVHWIARVLDLELDEVTRAIDRLVRLEILRLDGEQWIDLAGDAVYDAGAFSRLALEHASAQAHALFARARETRPPETRERSSTTLAVRAADVPQAIERLARFRREFAREFAASSAADDLYLLDLAFFPLTPPLEEL